MGKVTFRISQRETRRSCTREAHGKFTTSFAVRKVLSLLTQLHDLWVAQLPGFQLKTQQCADFVESLASCSAGVEVNSAPRFVLLDQQEVGMSTYKDVRPVRGQPCPNALGVPARSPSNVGHPDATPFTFEVLMFGKIAPNQMVINVAVHCHQGLEQGQGIGHLEVPDISGMPDFIAARQMMQDAVVHVTVGVAEKANPHGGNFVQMARLSPSWRSPYNTLDFMPACRLLPVLILLLAVAGAAWGQPGPGLHSSNKKAVKLYRKAMEMSRAAMVPGSDAAEAKAKVEADLIKALELDPGFAEVERVIAALNFDEGQFSAARDHYAHYLSQHGADFIRDHLSWAEAARHALDPGSMKTAMSAMLSIPGVPEGPDVAVIDRINKDAAFMSAALAVPHKVVPIPLPDPVSTAEDEYFPSIWMAGEALVFTRRVLDARWQQGQEDLFISRKEGADWGRPQPLYGLNTLDNEGAASLSGDGMTICFTMCREADRPGAGAHKGSCDLYIATKGERGWSRPENIAALNSAGWESQPCLSPDGQQLYFTRGVGRPGRRKHDLFMAQRQADGSWGQATRLGGTINSAGKETRPFIHPDGRHFYFASDGRPGMGGMDMFVSTMEPDGRWGTPVNLGWPLNTPDDETGLVVASDGTTGYFSREVEGQLDVHAFTLPAELAASPTAAMEGRFTAPDGRGIPNARISLVDRSTGEAFSNAQAGADGSYHVPVPRDRAFVVNADAPGFMLVSETIERGVIQGRFNRDFVLQPLVEGAEVVLKNVFFSSGSAALDEKSGAELQRVGTWLSDRPEVRMEVGGHTDDVGTDKANLQLSEQRAEAVRQVLIGAGALPEQLTAKGYGRSEPAVEGTSDTARRQNRRTTLRVVSAGS